MVITPKHAYVDATCKVSHPYLTAWNPVQELIGLMNVLRQIFSENPPVRSKPANAPPPYPGFGNPAPKYVLARSKKEIILNLISF